MALFTIIDFSNCCPPPQNEETGEEVNPFTLSYYLTKKSVVLRLRNNTTENKKALLEIYYTSLKRYGWTITNIAANEEVTVTIPAKQTEILKVNVYNYVEDCNIIYNETTKTFTVVTPAQYVIFSKELEDKYQERKISATVNGSLTIIPSSDEKENYEYFFFCINPA